MILLGEVLCSFSRQGFCPPEVVSYLEEPSGLYWTPQFLNYFLTHHLSFIPSIFCVVNHLSIFIGFYVGELNQAASNTTIR